MLETLISSRIRRTLFEYLLTHPTDRFYLRGLAKALNLSVSPLRRELARLEHAGMLRAVEEGNIRFYTVNTISPAFQQLHQATQVVPSLSTAPHGASIASAVIGEPPARAIAVGVITAEPAFSLHTRPREEQVAVVSPRQGVRSVLRTPALLGAAVAGMALMGIAASLIYFTMTNERLASTIRHALTTRKAEVTVVAPPPSSAGVMRSHRWQVVPGGFGGFSSGTSQESY